MQTRSSRFQLTAARRRLPGRRRRCGGPQCFNSQPLEGGCGFFITWHSVLSCFNSQPLEGGCTTPGVSQLTVSGFQLTAARRRLPKAIAMDRLPRPFQLTAARRRLPKNSREYLPRLRFNSQPLEGGCLIFKSKDEQPETFQLTAARRRLRRQGVCRWIPCRCFNSQPLEGGCDSSAGWPARRQGFNSQPLEGGCS